MKKEKLIFDVKLIPCKLKQISTSVSSNNNLVLIMVEDITL